MLPYKNVKSKSDNYYCPEPKYICSNKDCRLEVFMKKECDLMPLIDNSYYFYGEKWQQKDIVTQSRFLPKLRRKVNGIK